MAKKLASGEVLHGAEFLAEVERLTTRWAALIVTADERNVVTYPAREGHRLRMIHKLTGKSKSLLGVLACLVHAAF